MIVKLSPALPENPKSWDEARSWGQAGTGSNCTAITIKNGFAETAGKTRFPERLRLGTRRNKPRCHGKF
ncbi:MAG: hypothetical protein GY904_36290 [Planctomycetaceae bacterium]|nr:hypothetical protein [Planctomycetaceae bacterium]